MRATALFDRFLSQENFLAACRRVANKGASGGIDLVSADEFLSDDRRLESLRASLQQGTYVPEPVSALRVPKFGRKGGYRELGLPTVADKVVQTALLQVVEPLAERLFLDTSYGYRPGKGAVKALRRVEHFLTNRKLSWVVTQDIDNDPATAGAQVRHFLHEKALKPHIFQTNGIEHATGGLDNPGRRVPRSGCQRYPFNHNRAKLRQGHQAGKFGSVAEGARCREHRIFQFEIVGLPLEGDGKIHAVSRL